MTGSSTLVLGGGVGGLMAATHLRRLLSSEHAVTVVERSESLWLCASNLRVMTGEADPDAARQYDLAKLNQKGIQWMRANVEHIDGNARTVGTSGGTLQADNIVIALGADKNPDGIAGFSGSALDLYDRTGAARIHEALEGFGGGRVVVLVTRTPFSCPAAPYEAAFLIEWMLRARGVRDRSEIAVYTPEDRPLPVAGRMVGDALVAMLADRGIEFHPEQMAMKVDQASRRVLFEVDDSSYDLLAGVPPHLAPTAVRASGLQDASGWIPVDPMTLETAHAGVFAIGDTAAVRLANGMFLPKAGVFADGQARVVAENIAARVTGGSAPARFGGQGGCYVEMGDGLAAFGSGNFYGLPAPRVHLEPPSERFSREKRDFERTILAALD